MLVGHGLLVCSFIGVVQCLVDGGYYGMRWASPSGIRPYRGAGNAHTVLLVRAEERLCARF